MLACPIPARLELSIVESADRHGARLAVVGVYCAEHFKAARELLRAEGMRTGVASAKDNAPCAWKAGGAQ